MKSHFMKIIILMITLSLCLSFIARAQDTSLIIRFHQKPGPSEKSLIHSAKGKIKRTCRFIPDMAVQLSDAEIRKIGNIFTFFFAMASTIALETKKGICTMIYSM